MSDMGMDTVNLKELVNKRKALVKRLGGLKYILRGSIVRQGNVCGKAVCRCKRKKNPVPHGPYNYLSHRSRKAFNTIFLNKKKLPLAMEGVRQYAEAIDVIYSMAEINFRILRYHYDKL